MFPGEADAANSCFSLKAGCAAVGAKGPVPYSSQEGIGARWVLNSSQLNSSPNSEPPSFNPWMFPGEADAANSCFSLKAGCAAVGAKGPVPYSSQEGIGARWVLNSSQLNSSPNSEPSSSNPSVFPGDAAGKGSLINLPVPSIFIIYYRKKKISKLI